MVIKRVWIWIRMHIAYFINQYPKVSHSFIRREILALERQGVEVQPVSYTHLTLPTSDLV